MKLVLGMLLLALLVPTAASPDTIKVTSGIIANHTDGTLVQLAGLNLAGTFDRPGQWLGDRPTSLNALFEVPLANLAAPSLAFDYVGTFQFSSSSISVPPLGSWELAGIPFSMVGTITGPNTNLGVEGSGMARLAGGDFGLGAAEFGFQPQPLPTPEPASALLVASGLLGLAAWSRRRK